LSLAGYVHAVSGERAKAEAKIQQLLEQKAKRYVLSYSVALVFAGLGETETALQWLEQAIENRDVHIPFLLDHKWNGLRSNEQFQQLLKRVGFSISNEKP
jgi:tetratricopeptide (TPR) repeat protein